MADRIKVFYKPVGGHIEAVKICTDLVLICHEEGRVLGLEPNPFLGYDFRGDWFLCGVDGDEFADVPGNFVYCTAGGEGT